MICDKDEQGNVFPLWFDEIDSCLEFLKGKCENGFLYFLQIDKELIKVGISDNIRRRLATHKSNLGNRIGTIGVIGNVKLYKQIEQLLHLLMGTTKKIDGEILFESKADIYDTETYKIPDGVEFKEMVCTTLKLLRHVYLYNSFGYLGEGVDFGVDIFNPNVEDKGLSAFLMNFL